MVQGRGTKYVPREISQWRFALDFTEFCARFPSVLRFIYASFLSGLRFIRNPILRFTTFRMRSILRGFALDGAFNCGCEIRHQQQCFMHDLHPVATVGCARSNSVRHSQLAGKSCPSEPARKYRLRRCRHEATRFYTLGIAQRILWQCKLACTNSNKNDPLPIEYPTNH